MTEASAKPEMTADLSRLWLRDPLFGPAVLIAVLGTVSAVVNPPKWFARVPTAITDVATGERERLDGALTERTEALASANQKVAETQALSARNQQALAQRTERIEGLESDLRARATQLEDLRSSNTVLVTEREQLRRTLGERDRALAELERNVAVANQELTAATAEITRLEQQLQSTVQRAEASEQRVSALSAEQGASDAAVAQLEQKLAATAKNAAEAERLTLELRALRSDHTRIQRELDQAGARVESERQASVALRARVEASAHRIAALNARIETESRRADEAARLAASAKGELQQLAAALTAKTDALATLERNAVATRGELESATAEVTRLERQYRSTLQRAEAAEERVRAVEAERDASNAAQVALEEKLAATPDNAVNAERLSRELRVLSADRARLQTELEQAGAQLATERRAAAGLRARADSSAERIVVLNARLAAQSALASEAAQAAASARSALALEQASATTMRTRVATLDREAAAAREAVVAAQAELETARAERGRLQDELAERGQRIAAVQSTLKQAQQDALAAQSQAETLAQERTALRDEVFRVFTVLKRLEEKSQDLARKVAEQGGRVGSATLFQLEELQRFRSEFFGRLQSVLQGREEIEVVGDRFVFQAEVLFDSGSAKLESDGREQLRVVASAIKEIALAIPPELDWILRIDGHTDTQPIRTSQFPSNWELSAARAISVVRYLIAQGVPPARLAANGFGEHHPLDAGESRQAHRRNRRIELKLTQR